MDALGNLGIDGFSVLLYLVNFGILLVLLQRFAYKPLMKMIDERQKRIKEDVEKAAHLREQLKKERAAEVDERKARLEELDERVQETKTLAREETKQILQNAEEQRDAILSNANQTAETTIAGTVAGAEKEILDRVRKVVTHVLAEGVPADMVEKSVQESWKTVAKNS